MKNQVRLHLLGRGLCLCIRRKTFTVGDTRLIVEDALNIFLPWRSTRLLLIAGTNAFYSEAPLFSFQHRLPCYTYCADVLKLRKPDFYRHALVLGCGGGTVPRWLLEEYPDIRVDVVDYSPEILAVCQEYFMQKFKDSDRLQYFCADARDFTPPADPYQFIFCDLFDGESLVPFVYDESFARKLKGILSADGLLLINCGWEETQNEVRKAYQPVFTHLKNIDREPWQTQVLLASSGELP